MRHILAYDLGTGGIKASLFDEKGHACACAFVAYPTYYPAPGQHEQEPEAWWRATVDVTRELLRTLAPESVSSIVAIGLSGHSLGVVPLDGEGRLLRARVPIWSDARAHEEAQLFFSAAGLTEQAWYLKTGCGFPPGLYSVFKMMWFKRHEPSWFDRAAVFLGTKDYINFRLTGVRATDPSYASGSGVYNLHARAYVCEWMAASGLAPSLFPPIVASTHVLGTLTPEAADALGLPAHVRVVAGGVDNSCMALGAGAYCDGKAYNALGSSSWIAISHAKPVLDAACRPYVFDHVVPGQYASALAIFSAGTSHGWLARMLFPDDEKAYEKMDRLAEASGVGAGGLFFNPTLAGGSALDATPAMRGGFANLALGHTRGDMARAVMEGVAFALRQALDVLRGLAAVEAPLVLVGGGAKAPLWRQIYANVYGMDVVKADIAQQAASLGAAVVAGVGCGVWEDFGVVARFVTCGAATSPVPEEKAAYDALYERYLSLAAHLGAWAKEGIPTTDQTTEKE